MKKKTLLPAAEPVTSLSTKRPWMQGSHHPAEVFADSELDHSRIADCSNTSVRDQKEQEANAALIVKAVNLLDQHEQIVKELVRFVEHYENKEGQLGNGYARTFLDKAKGLLFNLGAPVVKG